LPGQFLPQVLAKHFAVAILFLMLFLTRYASENIFAGIQGNKKEDKIGLKRKLYKYLKFA